MNADWPDPRAADRSTGDDAMQSLSGAHTQGRRYRPGPNRAAVWLGICGLVVATLVIAHELGAAVSNIANLPLIVLGLGGLCVLIGVIGLFRGRKTRQ